MHPRFDLKSYYTPNHVVDFLKEAFNLNLTSNFRGFGFTRSAYSKSFQENLQQKSLEIVGVRIQNVLNPSEKLQTSNISLKLVDPSSRKVVFAAYSNLSTSTLKFYVPGPKIWINADQRQLSAQRGLQTQPIAVEVQGGALDDLELLFDLRPKDPDQAPRAWDSGFDSQNKEFSDFEKVDWLSHARPQQRPNDRFSADSGFGYDSWSSVFGVRNQPGVSSVRDDIHQTDPGTRDVTFGVSSADIDLALGTAPPDAPATTPASDSASVLESFLGVRPAEKLQIFLNSFERNSVAENESTFYFDDRHLRFSPQPPVFNLFERELEQAFVYLPHKETLVPWEYCQTPFPSFDSAYIAENYGRETFKTQTDKPDDPAPAAKTPSLETLRAPDSMHYQFPRELSALFWPLKLRLPLGTFRREFKISLDRNFPLGEYTLTPVLKSSTTPLIYTKLNTIDVTVTAVDLDQTESFSPQTPAAYKKNLTNSPTADLALQPAQGRHPVKVLFNKALYLNGETLPLLILTPVAVDTVLYIDFFYKTEPSFMRPVPQRVTLNKHSPRAMRSVGFANSKSVFTQSTAASECPCNRRTR